jgi:hypothetical protein
LTEGPTQTAVAGDRATEHKIATNSLRIDFMIPVPGDLISQQPRPGGTKEPLHGPPPQNQFAADELLLPTVKTMAKIDHRLHFGPRAPKAQWQMGVMYVASSSLAAFRFTGPQSC